MIPVAERPASVRIRYEDRIAAILDRRCHAPVAPLVREVLELLEDAAVRAAGRAADAALAGVHLDIGRRAEASRAARNAERSQWESR